MNNNNLKKFIRPIHDLIFRRKDIRNIWGGAFNGQEIRREIFRDIVNRFDIQEIYETGSFRGNTTLFMQKNSNAVIHSIEAQTEYFRYAKLRFLLNFKIHVYKGDSRKKLRDLISQGGNKPVFFYLDAHWNEDLPLAEEIEIAYSSITNAIILIDDFKVEGDPGYEYDDYGPGKALNIEYIEASNTPSSYIFFPISSEYETGSKRGCSVITNNLGSAEELRKSKFLFQHK